MDTTFKEPEYAKSFCFHCDGMKPTPPEYKVKLSYMNLELYLCKTHFQKMIRDNVDDVDIGMYIGGEISG